MQIIFNIAENSSVELVKGEYELVQGECCVQELKFNFPATIRGVAIGNYKKRIEFGECKDLGECVKFIDDVDGDTYALNDECTAFKKIMVQLVLSYGHIVWKTVPVALEFRESVNAAGNTVIQAQILTLQEIEREWENYIKAHTLRIIYRAGDVPTANASNVGDTIFYLGANTDSAPLLEYGHYYRCNEVNGVYEWTDLTQDPSLEGVANGIREINKNQTLQVWKGNTAELENEVPQENVAYIAEDVDLVDILEEYVPDIKVKNAENAGYAEKLRGGITEYAVSRSDNAPYQYYTETITNTGLYVIRYVDQNAGGESALGEDAKQAFLLVTNLSVKARSSEYGVFYNADAARIETESQAYRIESVYKICGILEQVLATVAILAKLSQAVDCVYYTITVPAGSVSVGDKLIYAGEQATVTEYDEGSNTYTLKCEINGNFAAAIGKSIRVEVAK